MLRQVLNWSKCNKLYQNIELQSKTVASAWNLGIEATILSLKNYWRKLLLLGDCCSFKWFHNSYCGQLCYFRLCPWQLSQHILPFPPPIKTFIRLGTVSLYNSIQSWLQWLELSLLPREYGVCQDCNLWLSRSCGMTTSTIILAMMVVVDGSWTTSGRPQVSQALDYTQ